MTFNFSPGVSWSLTFLEMPDANTLTFAVGKDCPYFETGYTKGKLYINSANGVELQGPGEELYRKLSTTGWDQVVS